MNNLLQGLKENTNYTYTENGALTHSSTLNATLDLFALGGAYRSRSKDDVIYLFKKAYDENALYAARLLFYLRDARGGAGERRFFRECMTWLANAHTNVARQLLKYVPIYGRYDDLYCLTGTPLETDALDILKVTAFRDMQKVRNGGMPLTLCGKWLKSENASSTRTKELAALTRKHFNLSPKEYRKMLSTLREKIKVVERLMSQNKWDEIEFGKLPSKAGIQYKNAFMNNQKTKERYKQFIQNKSTKVNASTLYPYEIVQKAINCKDDLDREVINKYWDNLTDYFNNDCRFNGLAVVDTSGSMTCSYNTPIRPIDVAISLGIYCAERASGPFAGHYISFASRPQLIATDGIDFVDKVQRIEKRCLIDNTNIEAVFDLLLTTALKNRCSQADIPENIIIISDMEFDMATGNYDYAKNRGMFDEQKQTLMENIATKWKQYGYKIPALVYWNVNAENNNIPDVDPERAISYVSGASPSIFKQILSGKTGWELCLEVINDPRYSNITLEKVD